MICYERVAIFALFMSPNDHNIRMFFSSHSFTINFSDSLSNSRHLVVGLSWIIQFFSCQSKQLSESKVNWIISSLVWDLIEYKPNPNAKVDVHVHDDTGIIQQQHFWRHWEHPSKGCPCAHESHCAMSNGKIDLSLSVVLYFGRSGIVRALAFPADFCCRRIMWAHSDFVPSPKHTHMFHVAESLWSSRKLPPEWTSRRIYTAISVELQALSINSRHLYSHMLSNFARKDNVYIRPSKLQRRVCSSENGLWF